MSPQQFQDRFEAGRFLAARLDHYTGQNDVIVLALPRGGVPVAFEIARALEAPLDVFLVRKLGVPGYGELAMGAIASGGARVLNEEVVQHLGISEKTIEVVAEEEGRELERREQRYRDGHAPVAIAGRRVILVDDGLATGAAMRAAIRALRKRQPTSISVAVPIASADMWAQIRNEVDETICGRTPEPFRAVGLWYSDFKQLSDEEVSELLNRAAHERRARKVQGQKINPPNAGYAQSRRDAGTSARIRH